MIRYTYYEDGTTYVLTCIDYHNEQEQNGTNDMTIFMGDESFDSMENLITRVEAIVTATIPGHSILRMEGVIVPK